MAHVQYTYMVAYVYHSMSFVAYCMSACKGERALAPQPLAICLLISVYLIAETRQCQFLRSICWVPYAFEVLRLFLLKQKEIPFHLLLSLPSPWLVFFSLSGKSQDSPNTAQGADEKSAFGGEKTKSFDADFFPLKEP